jgi:hypothetical protein
MSYGNNDSYGDQQYRGNYGASGPDFSDLAGHAESHHGSSSSYFNEAASHLQQNHGDYANQDIDEDHAVQSHRKLYGEGNAPANSNELGAGAAMEALKKFTGGSGGGSSSGGGQNQLIGLAMSEAEKLFDQHGGSSGDKQSAINSAAAMAFKMYSKGQGSGLGGTGGPSGLLGLASKFL